MNITSKLNLPIFLSCKLKSLKKENGVLIDSIVDIATNKLFTIYQKPRARDYVDLYMILTKYKYSMGDLIRQAKVKFDWHIDFVKLGVQFLKVKEVKDYPRLVEKLDPAIWQEFFVKEARSLKKSVFY